MTKRSVYNFAAEAGIPTGIYLSIISLSLMLSVKFPGLDMATLILLIGFPFFLAWQMKRVVKSQPEYGKFSSLWLFGIYSIIFGTLICTLVSYLYLMFIDPAFIKDCLNQAIDSIRRLPDGELRHMSDVMQEAVEKKIYPTKTQFVTTMGWFTCFAGSQLSLLLAFFISRQRKRQRVSMFR